MVRVVYVDRCGSEHILANGSPVLTLERASIPRGSRTERRRRAHSANARTLRGRRALAESTYHERVARHGRTAALAKELKQLIRLAGKDQEALVGELPVLASFSRVQSADLPDGEAELYFILHDLIPAYRDRLPEGPDAKAIRELLAYRDPDGQAQTLSARYSNALQHTYIDTKDFGRRQEPRLLLDCARYFLQFDYLERAPAPLLLSPVVEPAGPDVAPDPPEDPPTRGDAGRKLPTDPSVGIRGVYNVLYHGLLMDKMSDASEIQILNTWIPELHYVAQALSDALENGAIIRILMVHPGSPAATLRAKALKGSIHQGQVKLGVKHCLDLLAAIAEPLDEAGRKRLRVALYDAMPSLAIYSVDDQAFVSPFLHGHLAVTSPQIEVHGKQSLMGGAVFGEFRTLWRLANEVADLGSWQKEVSDVGFSQLDSPGDTP